MGAFNLVFFPGTAIYKKAKNDGILSENKESYLYHYIDRPSNMSTKNIKDRYLWSLLSLMTGKVTKRRLGFIPTVAINPLTWKTTRFFDKKTHLITNTFNTLNRIILTLSENREANKEVF